MAQITQQIAVEKKTILWVKWTGAFVLAEAIMLPVMQFIPPYLIRLIPQLNTNPNLIRLPIILFNGLVYAFFSAWAIRRYLPNFRLWIFLSSTAWILGSVVSISPVIEQQLTSNSTASNVMSILASVVALVPHGIMQWLMLRVRYQKSGFLILWYFGAGAIINLVVGLLYYKIPSISTFLSGSSYWMIWGINLLVEFCLFGIAGIGIVQVLNHAYPDQREPDPERRASMELLIQWVLYGLVSITIFEICQAAGWLSLFIQGFFSNPPWDALLIGLIYGLLLGLMQFLFFRQQVGYAYLWIVASIIGGGLLYISQSAGANANLLTGNQNQPAIYLILAFQAFGWLALGVCQAVSLNMWQYPKSWAWVLITFAGYGLSYLAQFFISQRLGLVLLPVLTGLGILYILKTANGETWYVAQANSVELTPDDYETLRFILQARLNDMPGKKMKVSALENRLAVFPVDLTLDESLTSLLTQPGKVSIFRPANPGASEQKALETAAPILTGEDILSAILIAEDTPDQKLIRLTLTEEGSRRLNEELEEDASIPFTLLLDGVLIHNTPLEISKGYLLEIRYLDADDACYYCAILNNDSLPFAVSLDKGESASFAVELAA